ncbi:MAG: factor-independent urate hydroxylase [Planctomycetota bacterium]
MPKLLDHTYGKHTVRVSKILRNGDAPDRHGFVEATVDVELKGAFDKSYTEADNRSVIATDSIRNTVYAVAHADPWHSIESFGAALAGHFLTQYDHVSAATVRLREHVWHRLSDHDHAFTGSDAETPTAEVSVERDGPLRVTSGIDDLMIAKTTQSGFENFVQDDYRSLPDTDDRILATVLRADWVYAEPKAQGFDFPAHRASIRTALMSAFVDHYSVSVQQTLYLMGSAAVQACPAIERITLTMPNKHHLRFPLEKIGRENPNGVFEVTDAPAGFIQATVGR